MFHASVGSQTHFCDHMIEFDLCGYEKMGDLCLEIDKGWFVWLTLADLVLAWARPGGPEAELGLAYGGLAIGTASLERGAG